MSDVIDFDAARERLRPGPLPQFDGALHAVDAIEVSSVGIEDSAAAFVVVFAGAQLPALMLTTEQAKDLARDLTAEVARMSGARITGAELIESVQLSDETFNAIAEAHGYSLGDDVDDED